MSINFQNLKVALVHDWLLSIGGAEKVLKTLHEIFPQAPMYTLFYNKKFAREFMPKAEINTTYLQKTYQIFKNHKLFTPFLPMAIESIDLSGFDVIISSSVTFAKGLILKPKTTHICYCYSPTRQIWDWHAEYKTESGGARKLFSSVFQHFLRIWDRHAANRVDSFIAISENVRNRIQKYYRCQAEVVYPPVELPKQEQNTTSDKGYFLIVSRLFKHKNIDIAIEAFNKLEFPLIVIGEGPEFKRLKRIAAANIKLLGWQPDPVVHEYYAGCTAFIMPQQEDFGITPIEAMSYGKPVLALKQGGALEYIEEGINGEFFEDPTEEVLADGIRRLKENLPQYNGEQIKKTAQRFSRQRFENGIKAILDSMAKSRSRYASGPMLTLPIQSTSQPSNQSALSF